MGIKLNHFLTMTVAAILVSAGYFVFAYDRDPDDAGANSAPGPLVKITLPNTLSTDAKSGWQLFEAECAVCHGTDAVGKEGIAPPLVHRIYEPSHHADESFQQAVALGVRAHHWTFGNMPPVAGLSRADVALIVAYVRELQRANGIN
ncbi:cytochrome c [uncultured Roseibium sp.]|uniref:c-type cytochrome n=1 Tax=uncultured Roseibium sp. TaxID=1936171 RepID=UPI0026093E24|nr:cytochrome c [uncultured Roseibium sp.]